ncbi:ATP-binding cassette sub-family C member 4-like [Glandiceps talaboti]
MLWSIYWISRMKPQTFKRRKCPEETAGWLSWLLFTWLHPIFMIGWRRDLRHKDLFDPASCDRAEILVEELARRWKEEKDRGAKSNRQPSIVMAIVKQFGIKFGIAGVVVFVIDAIRALVVPLVIRYLTVYFSQGAPIDDRLYAYLSIGLFTLCGLLEAFSNLPTFLWTRLAMQAQIALSSLLYKKTIRLNDASFSKTSTGQIVNLLSNDVTRLDYSVWYLHSLWSAPLSLILISCLLWYHVGVVGLAGVVFLLTVSCPLQIVSAKLTTTLTEQIAQITDKRVRFMSEIISGIRVIKLYAWEKPFTETLRAIRNEESTAVRKYSLVYLTLTSLIFCTERMITFVTIVTTLLLGYELTPEKAFIVTVLSSFLCWLVASSFTGAIQYISELRISFRRIEEFLCLEEVDTVVTSSEDAKGFSNDQIDKAFIKFDNVNASWDKGAIDKVRENGKSWNSQDLNDVNKVSHFSLKSITLQIDCNKLTCLVGPVGSGKSSILLATLGELHISKGSIDVRGKIAYVPQEPWIFSGTLRDNITFGRDFDSEAYDLTLEACALTTDLVSFPRGDMTQVGERGINLSGGQKVRVALARAVYRDTDIYLLDDPLSAVDSTVGKHIMEKCICGLLRNKTCLLVTHQFQYLNKANKVLFVKDGEIVQTGNYEAVSPTGHITNLFSQNKLTVKDSITKIANNKHTKDTEAANNECDEKNESDYAESSNNDEDEDDFKTPINGKVYLEFVLISGVKMAFLYLLCNVISQTAVIISDITLAGWEYHVPNGTINNFVADNHFTDEYHAYTSDEHKWNVFVYVSMVTTFVVFIILRSVVLGHLVHSGSNKLHDSMFSAMLHTSNNFFVKNPSGQVLNRFSRDIKAIDQDLVINLSEFMDSFFFTTSAIVTAMITNPYAILPTFPLWLVIFLVGKFYTRTCKSCEKLQSSSRGPIFSHLAVSLHGLHSIRAFKMISSFESHFNQCYDNYTSAWFFSISAPRWLALYINGLYAISLGIMVTVCIFAGDKISPGEVALILSFYVTTGILSYIVQLSTYVQQNMNSVARALIYTKLEPEQRSSTSLRKPPIDWPRDGQIEMVDICLAYSDDGPKVLHNLTFKVKAGEKIGIVGRTGAGKSSIMNALCRMTNNISGYIRIDGVHTENLSLFDLRSRLSVIPQDPVFFSGTLRYNLDPFSKHDTTSLWNSLERVQLKSAVEKLPNQLDTEMAESGGNFSMGQRQLVCLARALLGKNKILIVDEATANVDHRTDTLIQETIRTEFSQCTVLTIAHRLNTVMDSDRMLVMESGNIVEFDTPQALLRKQDGAFRRLLFETGHRLDDKSIY